MNAFSHHQMPVPRGSGGTTHDPDAMIREMRGPWLWTNATVISLGFWLMSSPWTFGYARTMMMWNDLASGALLVVLGAAAIVPRYDFYGRWGASFVGAWLQFAPLVLWAEAPAAYLNDTLVGALVIALTILVPMMPGMAHHMAMRQPGPEIPPGWSYCPSTWAQRVPIAALGLVGWLISRYLAAYQLGYIDEVWDPFFGEGTARVLKSEMSGEMPISDAGLGAVAYTFEMLMAWMGGRTRWRSMPWMVAFFFVLVVPLGLVHVLLVISQPVVVGEWCTLCLAAASVMLFMIPLAVDEVVATGQFLAERRRAGRPMWRTFWVGDTMEGGSPDDRTAKYGAAVGEHVRSAVWGVSLPWTLMGSVGIGLWVMASPALFGNTGSGANSDYVTGALVITVAAIATAEVIRAARLLNLLAAVWLVIAPFAITGITTAGRWNDLAAGLVLVLLTLPRGPIRERYAGWNRFIR